MKEHVYNIINTKDLRTQRQSNLNKFMETRFKISPQKFEDHTLGEIVSLKYVCEHGSSSLASRKIRKKADVTLMCQSGLVTWFGQITLSLMVKVKTSVMYEKDAVAAQTEAKEKRPLHEPYMFEF
ncbi:hypothetical protein Tco_0451410 [Tanacetum coccineum]